MEQGTRNKNDLYKVRITLVHYLLIFTKQTAKMDESSGSALLDHVSGLEFIFKQIKHDLSCAANTLDDAFDEAESSNACGAPHPMKLLRRLERIEAKASQLQTDWQDLEERREIVLPNVRTE
jgi:hypothetical protein